MTPEMPPPPANRGRGEVSGDEPTDTPMLPVAPTSAVPMSRGDRDKMEKVVNMRARLAKDGVDVRGAERLAEGEAALAQTYPRTHEAFADITAMAEVLIAKADSELAERCRALGIRDESDPLYVSAG